MPKMNENNGIPPIEAGLNTLVADGIESARLHAALLDERFNILHANRSWKLFASEAGATAAELEVGANYLDGCEALGAAGDASAGRAARALRDALADTASEQNFVYSHHSSGSTRWFLARYWAFKAGGKTQVAIVHIDITERVLQEDEAYANREKCESMLDMLPHAVVGVGSDGIIRIATYEAHTIFGYSPGELVGTSVDLLLPGRFREAHSAHRSAFASDASRRRMGKGRGLTARRKDGTEFIAELALSTVGMGEDLLLLAGIQDVDEKHRALAALQRSEERYQLAATAASDALWDLDVRSGELYLSPRFDELLGYEPGTLPRDQATISALVHAEERHAALLMGQACLAGHSDRIECEYRFQHRDTTYRWFRGRGLVIRAADGSAERMAGSVSDITERKCAEEQLLHDAFHDALTGLPNRALFMDRLNMAVARHHRVPGYSFALLLLDLDKFKNINDTHGHPVGDALLQKVSRRILDAIRENDTVARIGGDEFAVLVSPLQGYDPIKVAERIQAAIARPIKADGRELETSASIGIVVSASSEMTSEEILRNADIALYRAKAESRGSFGLFDREMHDAVRERLLLEQDLRHAQRRGELAIFLQPIVALATGRISGFEALLRWNHPERGFVPPSDFIPMAEESGLIIPLGEWVMRQACGVVRAWGEATGGERFPHISVNASPRELLDGVSSHTLRAKRGTVDTSIHTRVLSIISEERISPANISIEVTEGVLIGQAEAAASLLQRFAANGIRVMLDDFGTGYSSLSYLHELPFHTVKLDRSFICKLKRGSRSHALLNGIVQLTRNLGLMVTAEGVETAEQLEILRESGADSAQGYFFSRPVPVAEAFRLWAEQRSW